jgi:hypothetical protein
MTTITRTVTMIRTGQFKRAISDWFEDKLADMVSWLLSKRAVQEQVARAFSGETPMCHVLRHAIDSSLDGHTPNADDVEGLDRYVGDAIEEALNNHTVEVDDVEGLDRFVENAIEEAIEGDAKTELVKAVVEHIVEKLQE